MGLTVSSTHHRAGGWEDLGEEWTRGMAATGKDVSHATPCHFPPPAKSKPPAVLVPEAHALAGLGHTC